MAIFIYSMKGLISIFVLLFALGTCGGNNGIYQGEDGVMEYTMDGRYGVHSLDSLIEADTLPTVEYWVYSPFKDYETNERIMRMIYMKDNVVYVVERINSDSVKINKRILTVEDD